MRGEDYLGVTTKEVKKYALEWSRVTDKVAVTECENRDVVLKTTVTVCLC